MRKIEYLLVPVIISATTTAEDTDRGMISPCGMRHLRRATISSSEITFGLENAGIHPAKIKERLEATVLALKIGPFLGRNIFSMSGGEKQSLAFASVYAMNPSVFVLDEPTANLDAEAIDILRGQIMQIKKEGRTVHAGGQGRGDRKNIESL